MALDPREVVRDVSRRAHDPTARPPRLLARSPEPPPPLPSVQDSDEVRTVHRQWAQIHAADADAGGGAASAQGGVRAKVRARVATAASEVTRSAQHENRAMIGDLIRAVDTLAKRADELGGRLSTLESVVHELVDTVSEDLTQLRGALASRRDRDADPPPGTRR